MDKDSLATHLRAVGGIDHRWGERVSVDVPVKLCAYSLWRAEGRLKDLSLSGALLSTEANLRVHALIDISFSVSVDEPPSLIKACVVRRQVGAAGIEWCDFAPTAVRRLLKVASFRAPSRSESTTSDYRRPASA